MPKVNGIFYEVQPSPFCSLPYKLWGLGAQMRKAAAALFAAW